MADLLTFDMKVTDRRFAELLEKFGGRLKVRIDCAWCGAVLVDDPRQSELPISHTICPSCAEQWEKENQP